MKYFEQTAKIINNSINKIDEETFEKLLSQCNDKDFLQNPNLHPRLMSIPN